MTRIFTLCISVFLFSSISFSQIAWMEPAVGNFQTLSTIYVDVSQSVGGGSNGLKSMLTAHPDEVNNVYFWGWSPSDPVVGNGVWTNSTPQMQMTWVSDLLFSIQIYPAIFFSTTENDYYSNGISFLLKLDDGNAYASDGVGEAKTEDLHIDILPSNVQTSSISEPVIYPNPCNNELYLNIASTTDTPLYELYDNTGALVYSQMGNTSGICHINTSVLPSGFYQLVVKTDNRLFRKKVSVVHS